jgi:hypothetical protein
MRSIAAAVAVAVALPALAAAPAVVEDDYPRALAAARAGGKLLLVDAWAPW